MRKFLTRIAPFGALPRYEKRSSLNGSPTDYTRTDLSMRFIDSLRVFLIIWEGEDKNQAQLSTDPNQVGFSLAYEITEPDLPEFERPFVCTLLPA